MAHSKFPFIILILSGILFTTHASAQLHPEHGLHYEEPATVWDEAMPLGNGLLGALVWGDGRPLRSPRTKAAVSLASCPFTDECPAAGHNCHANNPALKEIKKGHLVACFKA